MSKNIDDVYKEINKTNKEIHNMDSHLSKDIVEIKRSVKNIENKIKLLDTKIGQAVELLNNFTILIADADEDDADLDHLNDDLNESDEWSPYDVLEDYHNREDEDEEDN